MWYKKVIVTNNEIKLIPGLWRYYRKKGTEETSELQGKKSWNYKNV